MVKEVATLNSLTGVRFFAALAIVYAHLTLPLHFQVLGIPVRSAETSVLGMSLFFVLSGFVIHYNYARLFSELRLSLAVHQFAIARFARLYPLFLAVLAFHLWHDDMLLHVWRKSDSPSLVATAFALNMFSWMPIWIDGKLLIQLNFGIAWSISTEWFFYFSYIFFARRLGSGSLRTALIVAGSVIAAAFILQFAGFLTGSALDKLHWGPKSDVDFNNSLYRWLFYVSPYSRVMEFLLGCACAQIAVMQRSMQWITSKRISLLIYCVVGLILAEFLAWVLLVGTYSWQSPLTPMVLRFFGYLHMNFGFAVPFAALILLLAIRDMRGWSGEKFLASSPLIFLGEISYSLYLVHPIAIRLVPLRNDYPNLPFRVLCGLFITMALATGTYMLIEKPGRRALRRLLGYSLRPAASVEVNSVRPSA